MTAAPSNRRIVLAAYPRGLPVASDFRLENVAVQQPGEGQVLLRTLVLSLDPYMRNLMDPIGPGYAPPVALGATLVGGTVSRVVASTCRASPHTLACWTSASRSPVTRWWSRQPRARWAPWSARSPS